jgi:hypothetical protein
MRRLLIARAIVPGRRVAILANSTLSARQVGGSPDAARVFTPPQKQAVASPIFLAHGALSQARERRADRRGTSAALLLSHFANASRVQL